MRHLELGRRGEDLAAAYLKRLKFRVLERNYRVRLGEIDIVARDRETLVFVEVKTRRSDVYALPTDSVGSPKQRKLRRVAELYLAEHDVRDCEVRFDVVSIVEESGKPRIEHIRNAF